MKMQIFGLLALWLSAFSLRVMAAGSLQVSPICLDLQEPSSVIHLPNPSDEPVKAQVRIFKWQQINGKEKLAPTRDVVASPPQMTLPAGGQNMVRVVSISKSPFVGKLTYRVLVDQ
jgi:fimbrial chaperone protein